MAHCVAIFWPRKPFEVATDENGLPILWRNESEQSKNVACVWWGDPADAAASGTSAIAARSMASFSKTMSPLEINGTEDRRFVA